MNSESFIQLLSETSRMLVFFLRLEPIDPRLWIAMRFVQQGMNIICQMTRSWGNSVGVEGSEVSKVSWKYSQRCSNYSTWILDDDIA